MKLRMAFIPALLTIMLSGSNVAAGYTFLFTDASGNPNTSFSVGVGQTVTIDVYVAQTGSSTGLSAQGLNSGGVQLNTSSPSIATVTSVTPNAQFDNSSSGIGANAFVTVNQVFSPAIKAPTTGSTPPPLNAVLLGAFTFTGQSAGSTLTVTAVPSTGTSVNVIAPGGADSGSIDSMLSASPVSASINVFAVPEPASMILCGLAVSGFGAGVLRRRFLGKKEQAAAVRAE
jgi:hypothetical protein